MYDVLGDDMQTKLTLRMEDELINMAKSVAEKKGKSLSKMVSDYFKAVIKKELSEEIIANYDVRVSNVNSSLGSLSGGNQQKVIFAREIELDNDILIFSHPTRGVDINATIFIHSKIIEQRKYTQYIL